MWITQTWFESSTKWYILSVLYVIVPLNFVKLFLAYDQRYSLEISTGMRIIVHGESEYAIFIFRERTLQNPS